MSRQDWYYGWRDVVAGWPDGGAAPTKPLVPWEQTKRERLQSGLLDRDLVEAVLRDPNVYRFAATIPARCPEDAAVRGGRRRQYPEWALVLFGCLKAIYGSSNAAEKVTRNEKYWKEMLAVVATMLGQNAVTGLPALGPNYDHYRTLGNVYISKEVIDRYIEDFEVLAAWRAVEIGYFDPNEQIRILKPNRLRAVSIDGKVHSSPTSQTKSTYVDKATGEIKKRRMDDARHLWPEGGNETMTHGSKFTWAMAQHTMANLRVVLSLRRMPPVPRGLPKSEKTKHKNEARNFCDMATRIADLLPGADVFLFDGAWRGRDVTAFQQATGRMTYSRLHQSPKKYDHLRINGTAYKAKPLPIHDQHPSRKWTCPGHALIAAGGGIWEGFLDAAGEQQFREVERIKNQRQTGPKGWQWSANFRLVCRHDENGETVHDWWESLNQGHDDDLAEFNRGEHLRLAPVYGADHARVYGFRAAVEGLNNTSEHTWYRDRLAAWGSHRQTLDMFMFGLVVNASTLSVYSTYALKSGASLPWHPHDARELAIAFREGQAMAS